MRPIYLIRDEKPHFFSLSQRGTKFILRGTAEELIHKTEEVLLSLVQKSKEETTRRAEVKKKKNHEYSRARKRKIIKQETSIRRKWNKRKRKWRSPLKQGHDRQFETWQWPTWAMALINLQQRIKKPKWVHMSPTKPDNISEDLMNKIIKSQNGIQ